LPAIRPRPRRLARTRDLGLRLVTALVLTSWALGALPHASGESDTPTAAADALHEQYQKHVKFTDFATFSRRMETIRALGRLDAPRGRKHLLSIALKARSIDDRIVAITTLGPTLNAERAKALADIVGRKRNPLLTQALGQAYMLASSESALTWLATDGLQIKEPSVLEAVLDAQSIHIDPRAREHLLAIYEKQKDRKAGVILAFAALRALGSIGDRRDRTFLLRAPFHADWRIRLASAETMARQKPVDLNIRNVLRGFLADDSSIVREAAAEGIGNAGIVELTDAVADLMVGTHLRTRAVAHRALTALHHHDLGWDPDDWKRWWKTRAGAPDTIQPAPSTSVATYYGVKMHSDRLLFIVDLSGSMAFPWGEKTAKTRIGVAKRELVQAIQALDEMTLFNVIVFSDHVKAWRAKGETHATKDAVASALRWIDKTFEKPEGGTYMHAALEAAFSHNPQIDTIFLLTDGLATDGEPIVPEAILASVGRWNRFRRVVVNTFALTLEDLEPDGLSKGNLAGIKRFMRRLAVLTGGQCKVVTKPPKPLKSPKPPK